MGQEARAGNVDALRVGLKPVSSTNIIAYGAEPRAMVALLEVDVNHPLQPVARRRGEEQLGGEVRVGNEPTSRFEKLLQVADVVEVDANQSTMAHEALVLTIGEGAWEASEAEVGSLELLAFLHVADGPQLARHVERVAVERNEAIDFADGHRPQTPDRWGRSLIKLKLS